MDITTRLVLQSQATRLSEDAAWTRVRSGQLRGYYPLWPAVSTTSYAQRSGTNRLYRPQFTRAERGDFRIELCPLHSPILGASLLVSFPPLNNMFKFSGSSYLSSALVLARS